MVSCRLPFCSLLPAQPHFETVTPAHASQRTISGEGDGREGTDRLEDSKRRQEERRGVRPGKKEREKRFAGSHVRMQGRTRSLATEGESLFMAPNHHYIRAQLFKLLSCISHLHKSPISCHISSAVQALTRAERGRAIARACDTARFHTGWREKIYSFLWNLIPSEQSLINLHLPPGWTPPHPKHHLHLHLHICSFLRSLRPLLHSSAGNRNSILGFFPVALLTLWWKAWLQMTGSRFPLAQTAAQRVASWRRDIPCLTGAHQRRSTSTSALALTSISWDPSLICSGLNSNTAEILKITL